MKFAEFFKFSENKKASDPLKKRQRFDLKNEIAELCKRVHCLDLDESFQTHIHLQTLASIQPRTSLVKFAVAAVGAQEAPGDDDAKDPHSFRKRNCLRFGAGPERTFLYNF